MVALQRRHVMSKPVPTLVIYRPKPGKENELQALVEKHWPVLDKLGLVTSDKAQIWKARDKRRDGGPEAPYFIELMSWKDEKSSDIAHQTPEVMAVWEPMGGVLEDLKIVKLEPI